VKNIIVTHNVHGNLHAVGKWVNERDLADYIITMDSVSPAITILVMRMPEDHYNTLRADKVL
jgi:hypothetical protein